MASAQTKICLTIGSKSMTATLADNAAAQELVTLLAKGPITIDMEDYGGFEKVGALPQSLPASNSQITTAPGDIMLYQSCNVVIFYGSNSWSYTRLGKLDDATVESVRDFLGIGDITLEMSLCSDSGIMDISSDIFENIVVYDLNGRIVKARPLRPGIYVIDNQKVVVK